MHLRHKVCIFILFSGIFLIQYAALKAQGFYDSAPRFSEHSLFGSAKSMGMGGVQMGTGGDGSALSVNPASPGMFRKSDIQFSLMPYLNATTNSFRGTDVRADKSGMPIGSFSLSLTSLKTEDESGDIRAGVFTVSYNRTSLFNRRSNWEGENPYIQGGVGQDNSIIDGYLNGSKRPGYYPSDLISTDQLIFNDNFKNDLVMAYDAYLLDTFNNSFVSKFPRSDLVKTGYFDQKLTQGVWNFGYSINVKEKLFFGFSLGYLRSNYSSEVQYGETIKNVVVEPNNPEYSYYQRFRGVNFQIYKNQGQKQRGVNGNLGIIYKISDEFRFSGAVQLPSITWINETYSPRVVSNFNGLPYWLDKNTPLNSYNVVWFENTFAYKLRLPARFRAGLTYIAGKQGMVGLDLEYTDLSTARLTEGDGGYNFISENRIIEKTYKPTLNVKIGGEYRQDVFRFRLGFAYHPSPLQSNVSLTNNVSRDAFYYTAGIGGRYEGWFWDTALVLGYLKTRYNFVPGIDEDISTRFSTTQLRLGIGIIL